ncbi:uncharacterized protein LOC119076890 [Bradysia coprophila]|uniref:uncharacterized protein LOC119076890 n=1 Tax=Bradysia coprophila TaxID=38358 RepID=UPI00187DD782|nr:uncharacterized protein LOC119076890 [Bradysia coprophila]
MYKSAAVCVFLLFMLLDQSNAVRCYRCTVAPTNRHENRSQQLCLHFSESDEFVVDCPYSTMCVKKIFKYQLLDGVIETVERNCADQKYTEPDFKNGAWQDKTTVEEPYEKGCSSAVQKLPGTEPTTYCYCKGSLCNSANKETFSYHTDAMAVIFVFNAMKYLRNVD